MPFKEATEAFAALKAPDCSAKTNVLFFFF